MSSRPAWASTNIPWSMENQLAAAHTQYTNEASRHIRVRMRMRLSVPRIRLASALASAGA